MGLTLAAASVGLLWSSSALAQPSCFGSRAQSQTVVDLGDTVRINGNCEYALRRDGPWASAGALAGRSVGFIEIYQQLSSASEAATDARPRFVYGRPPGRRSRGRAASLRAEQVLVLRFCAHYLMEEELGFRLRSGERLTVQRTTGSTGDCGADALELRAVSLGAAARGPMLSSETGQILARGAPLLRLTHGAWAFYAARPGAAVGLRVGQLSSRVTHTPLRDHLRMAAHSDGEAGDPALPALMLTGWGAGGLALRPGTDERLRPTLWSELVAAASAEQLWVATKESGGGAPMATEPLHVEQAGRAARLPDALVGQLMERRYGSAGRAMAPSVSDWKALLADTFLCLSSSYRAEQHMERGARIPDSAHCTPLAKLAQVAVDTPSPAGATPRACVERGLQIMAATGAAWQRIGESCVPLDNEATARTSLAVHGDRLTLRGVEAGRLCLTLDNRPLDQPVEGELIPLEASGLLEVRLIPEGAGAEACGARQGVSVFRLAVLDAEREWHPVGVHTGGAGPVEFPWRELTYEEHDVFSYASSRQELSFRLSSSAPLAASFNGNAEGPGLGQHVPRFGGVEGQLEGSRASALVTYLSRGDSCPLLSAGELRAEAPLDPDDVPVDGSFHVFLAADRGNDRPLDCLARARFRVRPSRVFAGATVGNFLRFEAGVLGDVRTLLFFLVEPVAAGISAPLLYLRMSPLPWFGFEFNTSLVAGSTFRDNRATRTGLGFVAAAEIGIPEYAPRLLSVGLMGHLSLNDEPGEPTLSVFAALNVSTLFDLVGGR